MPAAESRRRVPGARSRRAWEPSPTLATSDAHRSSGPQEPLDPLTREEIARASRVVKDDQRFSESTEFVAIALKEPPKASVLSRTHAAELNREALVTLLDRSRASVVEAVVALKKEEVKSWVVVAGMKPPLVAGEASMLEARIYSNPKFRRALARRGVDRPDSVMVDLWPGGCNGQRDRRGRRCLGFCWLKDDASANGYSRPIEGLVVVVDLETLEVVDVEDHGPVPIPPDSGRYSSGSVQTRSDLKPLEVSQVEGPSFKLDGHLLEWQKWRMRLGFNPREGLILYTVGYRDKGRMRPILYRGSVSEILTTYGDPRPAHYRKTILDVGEIGIGSGANSLRLGCDCLGEVRYLDAAVSDHRGDPVNIENAICIHEEDYGILWKHTDLRTGGSEVRRSRRLVVSWIATVTNYDYGFYWYFYQDGTIEFQVKLTGIVNTGALGQGETREHGTLVAPQLYASIHQHFFNVRLDLDIDGVKNEVFEVNVERAPSGRANPHGNAFLAKRALLRREKEARRLVDPFGGRHWLFVNPHVKNATGAPVGYKLVPGDNAVLLAQPGSTVAKRAGFANRHVWITPYREGELYAAGDYPYQHPGGEGLPAWTRTNRSISDTDLVLWYTMGSNHVVRPEDWPVMPVCSVAFALKPVGFFDENPSLDVPASSHCHC